MTVAGVQQAAVDALCGLTCANARRPRLGRDPGLEFGLSLCSGFRPLHHRHRPDCRSFNCRSRLGLGHRLARGHGLSLGLGLGFCLRHRLGRRIRYRLGCYGRHWDGLHNRCCGGFRSLGRLGRLDRRCRLIAHGRLRRCLGGLWRRQPLGNLGYRFDDELVLVLGVIPASVDEREEGQRKADQPALRHTVFRLRRGEQKFRLGPLSQRLLLVGVDRRLAVDAQVLGIGAHETNGINRARQVGETAFLEGQQVFQTDTQGAGDGNQIEAVAHACRLEVGADAVIADMFEFRTDLAQM